MQLELRRVVIFTTNMAAMARFYRDVIGLAQIADELGWKAFAAGGCSVALHRGAAAPGRRPPKLAFFAADVAAARDALIARGAAMGKLVPGPDFDFCDGKDPDGNPFQISSRV